MQPKFHRQKVKQNVLTCKIPSINHRASWIYHQQWSCSLHPSHPQWIEVVLFPSPKLNLYQNLPPFFPHIQKKTTHQRKQNPFQNLPSDYPHTIPPPKKKTSPNGPIWEGSQLHQSWHSKIQPWRWPWWKTRYLGGCSRRSGKVVSWVGKRDVSKPSLPVGLLNGEGAGKGDKSWAMFVYYGDKSPINGWNRRDF